MAIANFEVYKCSVCGNEVEVIYVGGGTLWCCKKPMDLLRENTTDASQEKHVPVVERVEGGVQVKVGSVAHPMEQAHLIRWIELIADGKAYRQSLNAGEPPETFFPVEGGQLLARAYCNLHGLWKA